VVVLDPQTGHVLAMVGSISWHQPDFGTMNMALAPRQSGSAYKPIVYSLAIDRGLITPASIIQDSPKEYPVKYRPENYDRRFRGPVTVRRALANSLNVPAVEIMHKVGLPPVLSFSRNMGITTLGTDTSRYGLSLVLGSGPVSLMELTSAYGVFANEGVMVTPITIQQITDKYGRIIKEAAPSSHQAIKPETAFLISSILSDRETRREVFGSVLDTTKPTAVKTGTTSNYRDALTIGYTLDVVIGVWVGNNNNQPMDSVAGSLGAAPIWKTIMESYLQTVTTTEFTQPPTVVEATVCPYVGHNTSFASTSMYQEFFITGTVPPNQCHLRPSPTPETNPPEAENEVEAETHNDYDLPPFDLPSPNEPPPHENFEEND
jgi:membrane carboxypeptidase/penicillin-binding protein PbpC